MLAVIRRTGRDFVRDRNIHPRGRNGWRTQLPGSFLTGGRAVAHPSFSLILSRSQSFSILSLSPLLFVSFISLAQPRYVRFLPSLSYPVRIAWVARLHRRAPPFFLLATLLLFLLSSLPLSIASAGNSEWRSPGRIARNTAYRCYGAQSF